MRSLMLVLWTIALTSFPWALCWHFQCPEYLLGTWYVVLMAAAGLSWIRIQTMVERGGAVSKFLTELDTALCEYSEDTWRLKAPLVYQSDLLGKTIEVPAGFLTDLASVPRLPIAFSLWGARAHREAVIHDYLYRIDAIPSVSRAVANRVFLEAMKFRGKAWWVRYPMYWGVCLGGRKSYHKKKVMPL